MREISGPDAPAQTSSETPVETRCGFVALLGAPNAGKSTLLNQLAGAKLSIVTHKVQTTRTRVRAVLVEGDVQAVLVDTPGIFQKPKRRLERSMVRAAWEGAGEADLVVLLVDAARRGGIDEDTRGILEGLKRVGRPAVLALNKIDAIKRERLLTLAAEFNAEAPFQETFMISAKTGDGVEDLRRYLLAEMPPGPWMFPEDQLSDLPLRLLAAELTREQLFLRLHEELPYSLTVETERWEDFRDGSLRIEQVIYVERDAQKAIALGKGGRTIKAVREAAQASMEEVFERKVHLFLFVKVRANWSDDPARYSAWGLDFNA